MKNLPIIEMNPRLKPISIADNGVDMREVFTHLMDANKVEGPELFTRAGKLEGVADETHAEMLVQQAHLIPDIYHQKRILTMLFPGTIKPDPTTGENLMTAVCWTQGGGWTLTSLPESQTFDSSISVMMMIEQDRH